MEAHTLEQVLESTLESVDAAEHTVLHEAQALGLDEDDLHRAWALRCVECIGSKFCRGAWQSLQR